MRLKKMIKKAVDTVVNPEEAKKLSQWKNRFEKARIAYESELELISRRDELYEGSRKVEKNPNSNSGVKKLAINVRNICYELIESQVDSSIPSPRVIPIHKEDEEAAKVIEAFLTNEIQTLGAEILNDQNERTTYVQGADFFHLTIPNNKVRMV